MIVYHFCNKVSAKKILREGLTLGCVPRYDANKRRWALRTGWQWVTTDPYPEDQSWATHYIIKYSRTEAVLTIDIPETEADRLFTMEQLKEYMPEINEELYRDHAGSENWRVYRGKIPKEWIIDVKELK